VHGDTRAARPLLEQAAESGYAPAQYNLARLCEADDPAAAARWYRSAAADFAPAAEALARLAADTREPSVPGTPADGRTWLLAQPPSAYTIQVGAGPDPQALARLLEAHAGTLPSAWFAHHRDGADPYVAVVGSFADAAAAEAALAALPQALTRHRPWVRRIASLQAGLDTAAPP
jgi:DamX protein